MGLVDPLEFLGKEIVTCDVVSSESLSQEQEGQKTLSVAPERKKTEWGYTGPTPSTLLLAPGPVDPNTLYVI